MNSNKSETWFFPYSKPTATSSVLNNDIFFNDSNSSMFQNIYHPYNPQYDYKNINDSNDYNMLEGQPEYQKQQIETNQTTETDINNRQLGLLGSGKHKEANIFWNNNYKINHPNQIEPDLSILPDGHKNFDNPDKLSGNLTRIIPWDTFGFRKTDDEYLNERNFEEVFNHPFYQQMKPILEQPFKHL